MGIGIRYSLINIVLGRTKRKKKKDSDFGNMQPLMIQDYASVDRRDAMNKSRRRRKEVRDKRSDATGF